MTIGHFYYHEAAQTSSTLMGIHALLLAILHMQETMQGHLSFVRHLCTMQFLFKILYIHPPSLLCFDGLNKLRRTCRNVPMSTCKILYSADPSNYHGIALLSTICKLLEKIMHPDFEPMELPPKYSYCKVASTQGTVACTGYSCLHTAFIFQETISH